jgi:hypothetical protein
MWEKIRQFIDRRAKERAERRAVTAFYDRVLSGTQCKYIRRGSKGDLLGCRWYFCQLQEGHTGPHKDPYHRDFQSSLHLRAIRKGKLPCEFVAARERTPWEPRSHVRCYRVEGHFGAHCDEYGGRFRSSLLDTDVFTFPGRWPVRTDPYPPMRPRKPE